MFFLSQNVGNRSDDNGVESTIWSYYRDSFVLVSLINVARIIEVVRRMGIAVTERKGRSRK